MKTPTIACLTTSLMISCLLLHASRILADEWPQWRGPNRDGVWSEPGIVDEFSHAQIKLRWRAPISSGYSGPTVADGRVYVTDRPRGPEETERVHCLDWQTGRTLWTAEYEARYEKVGYTAGPRASVTIDQQRAYVLGTMGHLNCYDAVDGSLIWKKTPGIDYQIRVPIWGISTAPLVDGDLLIVQIGASDGACIVALDKRTGEEKWRALHDKVSYSSPIIVPQAGRSVLICWTGQNVVGLDPASGEVFWKYPFEPNRMVINVPTPVVHKDRLFVTAFYDGSLMLRLRQDEPAVEKIWRRQGGSERDTDALHAMISTPYLNGDYIYGVDSYGELRCLEAATGDRVWEDQTATPRARWSSIHMVQRNDRVWMFNERGELIISQLSPQGFREISRAKLIEPTTDQLRQREGVCWSHPAYAYGHVFARNDRELVCADLRLQ